MVIFLFTLFSQIISSKATAPIIRDETITNPVTVSGISAGAFMATQFHVAFSSKVEGVGVLAGGPFYCALDDVDLALSRCMREPQNINVDELVAITDTTYATSGTVDNPTNMANDKVWVFSAMNDTVVATGVVEKVQEYYENYVSDTSQIMSIYSNEGEHAYLTIDQGSECTYLGDPYINACDFDAAGSILNHILDDIVEPTGD
jgi:poly(3-hydroxybutyrate) depolymerase